MRIQIIFFLILGLDALNLFFQSSQISIAYRETIMLYGDISLLQILIKISMYIFGQNDFALRLPMIVTHLLSVILLFEISKHYMTNRNRLWLVLIFILLPGVMSSAVLVDNAGLIIFGLLLFVWVYKRNIQILYYSLLVSFAILENNFIYLFLSLGIYSIYIKDKQFFIFNMFLFFVSVISFGVDAHGSPKGHFLDALGLYSAIFSPIIFLYIVYVLYRRYLTRDIDIIWFISAVPFVISLLLSFRQVINIEYFAPYLILYLPIAAQTFISSYRVRLKLFRKRYRAMFMISFIFLLLNSLVMLFNKDIYRFIPNPNKHFAYKFHIAKELANELKNRSINCVKTNYKMQERLYFYGVTKCDKYVLSKESIETNTQSSVTISYKNKPVFFAYVTKINN